MLHEREGDRRLRTVQKGQFARAGAMERTVAAAPVAPERSRVAVRTRIPTTVRTQTHTRGPDLDLSR